jgi:hypothetical protein
MYETLPLELRSPLDVPDFEREREKGQEEKHGDAELATEIAQRKNHE